MGVKGIFRRKIIKIDPNLLITIPGEKVCRECMKSKSIDKFYTHKRNKDGLCLYCIPCMNTRNHESYKRQRSGMCLVGKHLGDKRGFNTVYPIYSPEWKRDSMLIRRYNITLEDYNRMFDEQNGKCAVCRKPDNLLKRPLVVDHDHQYGHVRGLLCDSCNFVIGSCNESIETLQRAIDYIIKYQSLQKVAEANN